MPRTPAHARLRYQRLLAGSATSGWFAVTGTAWHLEEGGAGRPAHAMPLVVRVEYDWLLGEAT